MMFRSSVAAALVAMALAGQPGRAATANDDVLKPASVAMADKGRAALAKGDAMAAIDAFEAALASDPKNVSAFTGMAMSYEKLELPGKAVRYYREALALNPSDLTALEGQGKALIERGATARAQVNLARIKALCKTDCAPATRLQTALNEAAAKPKTAEAKPEAVKPAQAKN
jgi:Tfp pilus assembly protein PilF